MWSITTVTSLVGSMGAREFPLFGPLKKHLPGKQNATDASLRQAVITWLNTLDMNVYNARKQALGTWWSKSFNVW